MFTGIIQKKARVLEFQKSSSDSAVLKVLADLPDIALGESIAINGVCLTVAHFSKDGSVDFFLSQETLNRSNLGQVRSAVNLERALRAGDRFSGHFVQGHVDGRAILESIEKETAQSFILKFEVPENVARFCVEKGSIAIEGVSLTLNLIQKTKTGAILQFTVIPHTWENTCFREMKPGDEANVEIDILAKYVERLCLNCQKI